MDGISRIRLELALTTIIEREPTKFDEAQKFLNTTLTNLFSTRHGRARARRILPLLEDKFGKLYCRRRVDEGGNKAG